jgi:acyl carrier protein
MTVSYRSGALMTRAELQEILAKHSGLAADVFTGEEDTPLEQLGMESLAALEIQAVITDEYDVAVPEDEIPGMSFNDLLACIHAVQAERADSAAGQQAGD